MISEEINKKTEQIERTVEYARSQNEYLHSIHKLALKFSGISSREEVFNTITNSLVYSFNYDFSQVWIYDNSLKTYKIVSICGDRSTPPQEYFELLKRYINENIDIDSSSRELLRVGASASNGFLPGDFFPDLLISPIILDEETIGIVTAEYHRSQVITDNESKKFNESDHLFLCSVSSLISDTLLKTELFSNMEGKVEERTQKLIKTHEELTKAREIIIQSEKLSSLGRMAAGIIHQINNSLNFLVNIVPDLKNDFGGLQRIYNLANEKIEDSEARKKIMELAEDHDLNEHLEDMEFVISRTEKALGKCASIANSLRIFTSASDSEDIEETEFYSLIENVISMLPKASLGNVEINLDQSCRLVWKVNPDRMDQVFVNLINNAVDAMDGNGKIDIFAQKTKREIIIFLKDDGPGISEEVQKRMFDPFYTTKSPGKSTGLGLSISAEIVRQFGGTLKVDSQIGQGALFKIVFPLKKGLPQKSRSAPKAISSFL
ncbi:Sensory histidine kinase [Chitinispirillum alkaliphilum]|nr:Sensory histidine kinase [Chitinispirillum alkaliphilum]